MGIGRVWSVALRGVEGRMVEVEADVGDGIPGMHIVGLADAVLREAKDRVRAAVVNSECRWPNRRIVLALSPATLPKAGSGFDLAVALSILAAEEPATQEALAETVLLGELALDGRLRSFRGVLPSLLAVREAGLRRVVLPEAVLDEAALVDGLDVYGAASLSDVLAWLHQVCELPRPEPAVVLPGPRSELDLADVVGQDDARQACEIAAAGGHHMLMVGSPGTGKTMLARRFAALLPPLTDADALTLATVRSVVGRLPGDGPMSHLPPLEAPHHSSTMSALVGGGSGVARPGAVSLAHRGVLFLDEAPEMGPRRLEALRTPLEEGEVRIARSEGVVCYPARFQLLMAANPCQCAPVRQSDCTCTPHARRRYFGRLSGPLLDRVDLHVEMLPIRSYTAPDEHAESTSTVRARVLAARAAAVERWSGAGWHCNAEVPGPALRSEFALPPRTVAPLDDGLRLGRLTARGADRALRVT